MRPPPCICAHAYRHRPGNRQGRRGLVFGHAVYFGFAGGRLFQSGFADEAVGGNRTHPLCTAHGPGEMRWQLYLRTAKRGARPRAIRRQPSLFCPNGDVQETDASNFALINGNEIITKQPPTEEFLHGITRDSVLHVAADLGYKVSECNFTVAELQAAAENRAEATLTGMVAVVSPVTSFVINGKEIVLQSQEHGTAIHNAITDIQYDLAEDRYGWLCPYPSADWPFVSPSFA